MTTGSKKIDYRFKILYAIAIVMVVCSHIIAGTTVDGHAVGYDLGFDLFNTWFPFGSVQLAIFAFASGYFFKRQSQDTPWSYIGRKFTSLIVPMYIYNLIYGWIVKISQLQGFTIGGYVGWISLFLSPLYDGNQFRYNVGGWFVVPLFLIQTFNVLVRRFFQPFESDSFHIPEWAYFIFYLCLGLVGNVMAIRGLNTGWWLLLIRPLSLLPFYALGTFYHATLEKRDTLSSYFYLPLLLLIKYILAAWFHQMPDYDPMWLDDLIYGPIIPIIIGYCGIAFWLRVARILEPLLGRNRLVNTIADSTYSIMINQFAGFMLVKAVFAVLSLVTPWFADFRLDLFTSDIWWYYLAFGLSQSLWLYLAAGLAVPIGIQKLLNFAKKELAALDARSPDAPVGLRRAPHRHLSLSGT